MEPAIVSLLTLAGVIVGAALNNHFAEKSRRKERQYLAQENLLNALNDFYLDLTHVHYCVKHFREISDYGDEKRTFNCLVSAEGKITRSGRDMFKAYSVLRRYTKSSTFSMDELNNERIKFEEFLSKTYDNHSKLKDEKLNKELDDQITKINEAIVRFREKLQYT